MPLHTSRKLADDYNLIMKMRGKIRREELKIIEDADDLCESLELIKKLLKGEDPEYPFERMYFIACNKKEEVENILNHKRKYIIPEEKIKKIYELYALVNEIKYLGTHRIESF